MRILVTGGCGYIGSHVALTLAMKGHEVTIADLVKHPKWTHDRLQDFKCSILQADMANNESVNSLMDSKLPEAVYHFAGLKMNHPHIPMSSYFNDNVLATSNVVNACLRFRVNKIIFASSAAVYEKNESFSPAECSPLNPSSLYAKTKLMGERIIQSIPGLNSAIVRIFNPAAIHPLLFDSVPRGVVSKAAKSILQGDKKFFLRGNGGYTRDFIHILDVAEFFENLLSRKGQEKEIFNLGRGAEVSVASMIQCMERQANKKLFHRNEPVWNGEIQRSRANMEFVQETLGWKAKRNLKEICRDALTAEKLRLSFESL